VRFDIAYDERLVNATGKAAGVVPIFIGSADPDRWAQMSEWLPKLAKMTSSVIYRVNCSGVVTFDEVQSGIDCHIKVAEAALQYWGTDAGTYLDLEDDSMPSRRCDYSLIRDAAEMLMDNRAWYFVHLSRFPAPTGLIDPQTKVDVAFNSIGGNVYRKLYGTSELSQAMLDHTDHAERITAPTYVWREAYDQQFKQEMTHVVYPAVFQRQTEPAAPTVGISTMLPDYLSGGAGFFYSPGIYTLFDFLSAHGSWLLCLIVPIILILCLTNDWIITLWCFVGTLLICWALGMR